ncbi:MULTISPECIES: hypothetical protein [Microbulbifer]|uniref:hypothetical protein n=1 Tax=Microbulbifer TaxID=48073 RepID=UPI001E44B560|nr:MULTISPECIES: hypothetical protein [Microbulbifer]UHQ53790.1 hypothetical protein LVE68_09710 [Microbulbifer sp. YPW16]
MSSQNSHYFNLPEPEIRRLRQQLEEEIAWLDRQMEAARGDGEELDLTLVQTYKEMIFSRRALLGRIPR